MNQCQPGQGQQGQCSRFGNCAARHCALTPVVQDIVQVELANEAVTVQVAVWATAPAPVSITVRPGAGVGGSDRVTIIWPNSATDEIIPRNNPTNFMTEVKLIAPL